MKNIYKSKQFLAIASVMLCIIIGLVAALFFQLRGSMTTKESLYNIHSVEFESSMENLISSINESDAVKSYHFAMIAADHAAKCGERRIAVEIKNIAEKILDGGITSELSFAVSDMASARSNEKNNIKEIAEHSVSTALPGFIAIERYEAAKESAEKVLGSESILTEGIRNGAGEILFSCENAYALIDEKTSLPIEAVISAGEINTVTNYEDPAVASIDFLNKFFSKNAVDSAVLEQSFSDAKKGCVNVKYSLGKRKIELLVRESDGRVVQYFIADGSKEN